jgi:hyperosmotically inducible periplasmic protein
MSRQSIQLAAFSVILALSGGGLSASQSTTPAADNTKMNKAAKPTADQSTNSQPDRDIMQKIRKAVIADKSLSTYAHNVKIIAQNGKVTLRGPVHSQAEKESIEQKATDVAGAGNVTNEITVKTAKTKTKTNDN